MQGHPIFIGSEFRNLCIFSSMVPLKLYTGTAHDVTFFALVFSWEFHETGLKNCPWTRRVMPLKYLCE